MTLNSQELPYLEVHYKTRTDKSSTKPTLPHQKIPHKNFCDITKDGKTFQ